MRTAAVVLLVLPAIAGCTTTESGRTEGTRDTGTVVDAKGSASIQYASQVVVWKQDAGRDAVKAAALSNGGALLLDAAVARDLAPGKILVIEGTLARKIVVAEPLEGGIAVLTEPAGIGEIIQDGTLHLEYPVRFGAMTASAPRQAFDPWALLRMPVANAQEPLWSSSAPDASFVEKAPPGSPFSFGEIKEEHKGWKATYSATPQPNRLALHFELVKEQSGLKMTITGDGYLADFDVLTDIMVERTAVQKFEVLATRLNGMMNLSWVATQEGTGPIAADDRFKLPGAIQVPLAQYLAGFPLFLEVSGAFMIKPAFSGKNELSRGRIHVNYDGMQRFRIREGNVDSEGDVTGDVKILEHANLSPTAPMGMLVAFSAPRIELTTSLTRYPEIGSGIKQLNKAMSYASKLAAWATKKALGKELPSETQKLIAGALKSEATAYIQAVTSVGSIHSGMLAIVPCQRIEANLVVKVGAGADLFGMKRAGAEKDIFRWKRLEKDPPNVKCAE